jgi:hypothetical protein
VQTEGERFTEEVAVLSDVSDESGEERTSADEGVTPKGAGRRSKNTANGAKETGAAAPAGTLIANSVLGHGQ